MEEQEKWDELDDLLYWRCATDLELFSFKYFSHYCRLSFNELHRDLFSSRKYGERSLRRARAAPRGYAKSTLEALIEPIHDICYAQEKYIIIFSNTEDQSNQKLRDIRSEILTNDELVTDYGICLANKRSGETSFVVECGDHSCLVEGYGSNTEVRGVKFRSERPTKIVVDDGEHSEEVLNESIRKKYEDWMFQVVSKLGTKETNIKVIGTILHPESLLSKLLKNPAYDGKLYKAVISWSTRQDLWDQWTRIYTNIDDDDRKQKAEAFYKEHEKQMLEGTKVLWEQKESYLDLIKELIETGRRAFFKEKQNEPIGGDDHLFDELEWYHETGDGILIEKTGVLIKWSDLKAPNGEFLSAYGVLDPATGQTKAKAGKSSDFACLLTGLKDPRGRLLVHSDWTRRAAPTKQIGAIFEHHLLYNYQKFGVETNLYRNLLLPNIVDERRRIEKKEKKIIKIGFYDIEQVENKEKRIHTLEPRVAHGWILFNRALSSEFTNQVMAFPHGDHDDAPDSLEMLWGLMHNRYRPSPLSLDQSGA